MATKRRMILALAATPFIVAAGPSSAEKFAAEMIERFQRQMAGATFTPTVADPLAVKIKGGHWSEGTVSLHRMFQFCQQASRAECESEKSKFVSGMADKPPPMMATGLRLVVRDRQYLDFLREQGERRNSDEPFPFWEPIGEDLFAILAFDSPNLTAIAGPFELEKLGLTRDRAWTLALAQTKAVLPPIPRPEDIARHKAVLFEGHEYLGSLLIDRAAWGKLANAVGPNLFVTVVSDDLVLVGAVPDGEGMRVMKEAVAKDCAGARRCISPNVYRFRDGRWVVAK